jgi:alanine-alpha-ketoisovalerate/valine-pyruvate aminotransferase
MTIIERDEIIKVIANLNNGAINLSPGKLKAMMNSNVYNEEFETFISSIIYQLRQVITKNSTVDIDVPEKLIPVNYKPNL